jgi:benzodiazapine receptor
MNNIIISFIAIIETMITGSIFTKSSVNTDWYQCIKSDLTPPSYIFPIVWTFLYILLGVALKKILDKGDVQSIILFSINLFFNQTWTYLYFKKKNIIGALINILILIITSILILLRNIELKYYLIPYIVWVIFASKLNYDSIDKINKCLTLTN